MIGKSSNTLFYIGDGKLPVLGLLVKGVKRCVALGGGWRLKDGLTVGSDPTARRE